MGKILVIVGATATGKTKLGVEVARKFDGEVASADARQIYKYLNIGTGKDLPKNAKFNPESERVRFKAGVQSSKLPFKSQKYRVGYYEIDGVKVWLYDVIEPNQRFSAVEYAKLARKVIGNIWKRGKLPILVGGTGFYIKVALKGIETSGIEPDWELRNKLQKLSKSGLQKRLRCLNREKWQRMNKSDRNNPRRLIRAIEIALKMKNEKLKTKNRNKELKDNCIIGLTTQRKILYKRIDERVDKRIKQGIMEEIKQLLKQGYLFSDPGFNTLGYKEWKAYFNSKEDIDKTIQKWKHDEHGYARRQLTWFKKMKGIRWYDITKANFKKKVEKDVSKWYYK